MKVGSCDCCNRTNVELGFVVVCQIETWACNVCRGEVDELTTGSRVRLKKDPRHVGVVKLALSNTVRVLWDETGWLSDEAISNLELVDETE